MRGSCLLAIAITAIVAVAGVAPVQAADEIARTVSGRVLDEGNQGLGGVTVATSFGTTEYETTSTVTSSDGRWSLQIPIRKERDNPSKDRTDFTAAFSRGDDWITRSRGFSLFGTDSTSGVDMQLERYATVVGSVSPAIYDGSPLFYDLDAAIAGSNEGGFVNDDGTFRIEKVVPGTYGFSFRRFDSPFTSSWGRDRYFVPQVSVHSGETVDLGLTKLPYNPPTGAIAADFAGTGNADPTMSVELVNEPGGKYPRQTIKGSVLTEDTVLPGRYKVQFGPGGTWYGGGFTYASAKTVEVKAGQVTRIRGVRARGYRQFGGTVVNSAGEGVPGVTIVVTRPDSPGEIIATATTGQDSSFYTGGFFRISVPSASRYDMTIVDPGGAYRTKKFTAPAAFDKDDTYLVQKTTSLGPAFDGPASASASGSQARPGWRGRVCFVPTNGLRGDDEVACGDTESETGEHWTYSVDGIKPGTYKIRGDGGSQYIADAIWFGGRSFASATTVTFEPGQHRVIDLPAGPTGSGWLGLNIRDSIGRNLPNISVFAYDADNPDEIVAEYRPGYNNGLGLLPVRPYKLKFVDGSGEYATTWQGGSSFATAATTTPRTSADLPLPPVIMQRVFRALAPPVVTGRATSGHSVRSTTGHWGRSGLVFKYRWNRNGEPIGGATSKTYGLKRKDVGKIVTVTVTARPRAGGKSATATSGPTAKVSR